MTLLGHAVNGSASCATVPAEYASTMVHKRNDLPTLESDAREIPPFSRLLAVFFDNDDDVDVDSDSDDQDTDSRLSIRHRCRRAADTRVFSRKVRLTSEQVRFLTVRD